MMLKDGVIRCIVSVRDVVRKVVRRAAWFLLNNVPLGPLTPFITLLAMGRRKHRCIFQPDLFRTYGCDMVEITNATGHNGMWAQCHHCKGGFWLFDDYKGFECLVVDELKETPTKEAMCMIRKDCPSCGWANTYWFYKIAIKEKYENVEQNNMR